MFRNLGGWGGEQKLEIFDPKFVSALRPKTGYAQVLAMPGHKSHGEMEKVMKNVEIRPADIGDAEDILKIYAYYVTETAISFEYDVPTLDDFKGRMEKILEKYPYFVAVCDNRVVGYA